MAVAADPRGRHTEPLPEVSEELAAQVEEVRVSREGTSGPALETEEHLTEVPF